MFDSVYACMILATMVFWTNIKVIPLILKDVPWKYTIVFSKGLCSVILHRKHHDFFHSTMIFLNILWSTTLIP